MFQTRIDEDGDVGVIVFEEAHEHDSALTFQLKVENNQIKRAAIARCHRFGSVVSRDQLKAFRVQSRGDQGAPVLHILNIQNAFSHVALLGQVLGKEQGFLYALKIHYGLGLGWGVLAE